MYGLGYAAAEDRLAQMNLYVRTMQGRLAEIAGPSFVNQDKAARYLGYWRHAQQVVAKLPAEDQALLAAYAQGVNDYVSKNPDDVSKLFATLGFAPEEWTPAHCLMAWYRVSSLFQPNPFNKAVGYYKFKDIEDESGTEAAIEELSKVFHPGESAAGVVQAGDVPDSVQRDIKDYYQGLIDAFPERGDGDGDGKGSGLHEAPMNYGHTSPSFSHGWVLSGDRTTTGKAVLVSDPQTPITSPAIWYEWQASGETINARGIGIAGTPGLLIGYNEDMAWGLTAAGIDMADIFRLEMDGNTKYVMDGVSKPITSERETIKVAGGADVEIAWRTTEFGPIVTDLVVGNRGDQWAYKGVPFSNPDSATVSSSLQLLRARTIDDVRAAVTTWHYPSANLLAGTSEGDIFYTVVGDIPVRSFLSPLGGKIGQEGNRALYDWVDIVPAQYKPSVTNPAQGYIASANHRPAGDWYPIPIGAGTGGAGHTTRSARLYELVKALPAKATPQQVWDDVQFDCVNYGRRGIVGLGYHILALRRDRLSSKSRAFLEMTQDWFAAGGTMELDTPAAMLPALLKLNFRVSDTGVAIQEEFGGGENGLTLLIGTMTDRIIADRRYVPPDPVIDYIDKLLTDAWNAAGAAAEDMDALNAEYEERAKRDLVLFGSTLTGLGGDPLGEVIPGPAATCPDLGTIWSQPGQSYSHFVSFEGNDQALIPPGNSERPESGWHDNQQTTWLNGELYPASAGSDVPADATLSATLTFEGS